MLKIRRRTKLETRYHPNMGKLYCSVTRIEKVLFGFLILKTIHKYRETYYGEVKDISECILSK